MRRIARAPRRTPRPALIAACALVTVLAAGCGDENTRHNALRPPLPIVVSVSISDRSVELSPQRIGAGPITLLIGNTSSGAQQVTLETVDHPGSNRPGRRAVETGPINPSETASVQAQVEPDMTYELSASGEDIRPGRLVVGAPRSSPQNQLRTP
jgi:hypothetical protein